MIRLLNRIFRLNPGEAGLVLVMGFLLLSNSLALEISDVVALSGFLSQVGVSGILVVWLADMALIILTAGLQSLIIDKFNRISVMRWLSFGLAFAYVFLRFMFTLRIPGQINYGILYVLSDQQWVFFPLIFWVLANDIFDIVQAKRLFPIIASWGFIGQIIGLGIAAVAPTVQNRIGASSTDLLMLNVMVYLVTFVLITVGLRNVKLREVRQKHETVRETLSEGWVFVREVHSFRYLMLSMIAVSLAVTILEFNFLSVSDATITDSGQFQTFYSLYRLGLIVGGIVIQTLITSRLINKLGLKNTFLITPFAVIAGLAGIVSVPGIISSTAGIFVSRLSKQTVDESARKAFQALVPEERRGRVSMFMDSYLFAIGTILASLITGGLLLLGRAANNLQSVAYAYLAVAVGAAIFAIWAILRMRRVYDASLFNWRLKRRTRASNVLSKLDF